MRIDAGTRRAWQRGARGALWSAAVATMLMGGRGSAATPLPTRLDAYLQHVARLSAADRSELLAGAPVAKLLENVDESKEVAVFGAVWIAAPRARYVALVNDIEAFERGSGYRLTRRISSPPRLEDFADLRLPPEDIDDLRSCRMNDCALKLSEQALRRFRTEVDWEAPHRQTAASALMRRLALEYVTRYLEGGNDRLAVYRDSSRPTFVARELRHMIDQMPELTSYLPEIREYLLGFPSFRLRNARSFLYWQEIGFGLKPTLRISHVVVRESPSDTVVASKLLYASHYFWTGLELRVLLPDPARGEGFWLATVVRGRSDGLSGFTGLFVRRVAQNGAREAVLAGLRHAKLRTEER